MCLLVLTIDFYGIWIMNDIDNVAKGSERISENVFAWISDWFVKSFENSWTICSGVMNITPFLYHSWGTYIWSFENDRTSYTYLLLRNLSIIFIFIWLFRPQNNVQFHKILSSGCQNWLISFKISTVLISPTAYMFLDTLF